MKPPRILYMYLKTTFTVKTFWTCCLLTGQWLYPVDRSCGVRYTFMFPFLMNFWQGSSQTRTSPAISTIHCVYKITGGGGGGGQAFLPGVGYGGGGGNAADLTGHMTADSFRLPHRRVHGLTQLPQSLPVPVEDLTRGWHLANSLS
jgi:hypothetical protein